MEELTTSTTLIANYISLFPPSMGFYPNGTTINNGFAAMFSGNRNETFTAQLTFYASCWTNSVSGQNANISIHPH